MYHWYLCIWMGRKLLDSGSWPLYRGHWRSFLFFKLYFGWHHAGFPPSKMAFVTGWVVTMAMLGGLVAQTPLAKLNDWIGWRHAVLLNASLGFLVGGLIYFFVQDRPPNSHDDIQADKKHLQTLGFWRSIKLVAIKS